MDELKKKIEKASLNDLIAPGLAVIVVLGLVFLFLVPTINRYYELSDEIDIVKRQRDRVEQVVNQSDLIDADQANEDLVAHRTVIPVNLEVSDFVAQAQALAELNNLRFREVFAGDSDIVGSAGSANSREYLFSRVSGPISFTGSYQNIENFLIQLQDESPYLISIAGLSLAGSDTLDTDWNLEVQLSGFFLREEDLTYNVYKPFTPYTNFEEELLIFRQKASAVN